MLTKKQKKLPMALQKAIMKKQKKKKESEEIMPYHTGHGKKKKK